MLIILPNPILQLRCFFAASAWWLNIKTSNEVNKNDLDAVFGTRFNSKSKIIDYPKIKFLLNRLFNNFETGYALDNRLIAFESFNFIFLFLGLAAVYLNNDSPQLTYYKTAVYPVYIVHLPVQMAVMYFFAGSNIHPIIKFPIALFLICFLSLTIYHAVKNAKLLRPLFGLRNK